MANQKAESQAKEISELFVGNDEAKELARAMAREAIEKMKAEVRARPRRAPVARVRARISLSLSLHRGGLGCTARARHDPTRERTHPRVSPDLCSSRT